ncbi:hypothetical protein FJ250_09305 [bacterium]|nr:hypothetical protein [bacterium]
MDEAQGSDATAATAATPAPADGGSGGAEAARTPVRGRFRLPVVAKRLRPGLPAPGAVARAVAGAATRLPRSTRRAAADLVFAAGAASLVLSVVFVLGEPARARLQARADEARIAANAATLQLAVETHAAANGGRYARTALELLPWLPERRAPRNPYTDEPTLFRGNAGDLTYRPAPGCGYVIEAWGRDGTRPRLLATLHGAGVAKGH